MDFDVDLHDARLQALLHVGHGLVVNQGADLFEKKSEQGASGDIAYFFVHVLGEIALDRCDGLGLCFFGDVDVHAAIFAP